MKVSEAIQNILDGMPADEVADQLIVSEMTTSSNIATPSAMPMVMQPLCKKKCKCPKCLEMRNQNAANF